MAIGRDDILTALKKVATAEGRGDVVAEGLVSGLVIRDGNVAFAIMTAPERAAAMEAVRAAAERAVLALPGVSSVTAVLTAHKESEAPPPSRGAAGIGKIIAVGSGKGGVGKSTTAVNLALALKAAGARVGLLDADIYGPSIPTLLGLTARPETTPDKQLLPLDAFGLKVMSIGFLVPADQALIWRGPMVISALNQLLNEVAWGSLDILVIDLPPGTGDVQLSLAQRASLAGAVIVSTPQDLALMDARRAFAMFEKVNVPVLGLIENMSFYLCPHCGARADIFGHGGARDTASRLGIPFLGEVPLHLSIRERSDQGTPIVASLPDSPQAAAYTQIAGRLNDVLAHRPAASRPRIEIV